MNSSSTILHTFSAFAATAVVAAIQCYSALINAFGGTLKLLEVLRNVARRVLGDETMVIIDSVLTTLSMIYPRTCTLAELTTTMFTLILCQLRSAPFITSHGRGFVKGEDTRIMQLFSRFSIYASAAYCKTPNTNPDKNLRRAASASDRYMSLAAKNSLIQDQLGLHPSKIYPYVDELQVHGMARLEHFVAVDDAYYRVVLSFKGTNSVDAVLKDLDAGYYEAEIWGQRYHVHRGMWMAALDFLEVSSTLGQIEHELRANPNYSLAIVGHSLGGGVAALVTALLSQESSDGTFETNDRTLAGRAIECFTIGSGACMENSLAERIKPIIYTLVNGYDIVPYLSLGVVSDLCQMTRKLFDQPGRLIRIMQDLLTVDAPSALLVGHLMYLKGQARSKRLVPPGRVFVIVYGQYGGVENVEEVTNVQERFGYISLRQKLRLIKDHALHKGESISTKLEQFCN